MARRATFFLCLCMLYLNATVVSLNCKIFVANRTTRITLEKFSKSDSELYETEEANYCYFEVSTRGFLILAKGFNGKIGEIPPGYDSIELFGNNTDGNPLAEKIYSKNTFIRIAPSTDPGTKPYHPEETEKECPYGELTMDQNDHLLEVTENLRLLKGPYFKCAILMDKTDENRTTYSLSGVHMDAYGNVGVWNNKSSTEFVLKDSPAALIIRWTSLVADQSVPKQQKWNWELITTIVLGVILLDKLVRRCLAIHRWRKRNRNRNGFKSIKNNHDDNDDNHN